MDMNRFPVSGRLTVTGAASRSKRGVDRIAVHPHNVLLIDRSHLAVMVKLTEAAVRHDPSEVEVGLCPDKVGYADR
jgi:hypothetical protein